jgi:erythromycin esterase-like protein
MWRNTSVSSFSQWLKDWNSKVATSAASQQAGGAAGGSRAAGGTGGRLDQLVTIAGMDLYSLFSSADEVIEYLNTVDPALATRIKESFYSCFDGFSEDPQEYGQSVTAGWSKSCADGAVKALTTLYNKRQELIAKGTLILEEAKKKAARLQREQAAGAAGKEGKEGKEGARPSGQPRQPSQPSFYPPSDPTIVTGPHGARMHHEIRPVADEGSRTGAVAEKFFADPAHREFAAEINALCVADAEGYYRGMFSTRTNTWNLRDRHMVTVIKKLKDFLGVHPEAVVPSGANGGGGVAAAGAGGAAGGSSGFVVGFNRGGFSAAMGPFGASSSSSSSAAAGAGAGVGGGQQPSKKAKLVIWAHNSHLLDASAGESWTKNREHNVGMLLRQELGRDKVFLIGQYTATGTVSAASFWDGPVERKNVRPPLAGSYEDLLQRVPLPAYYLNLRPSSEAKEVLTPPRLQRAIGVIYKPSTERYSHYFEASLAGSCDGVVFFRETSALVPLEKTSKWKGGEEEAFPTGL